MLRAEVISYSIGRKQVLNTITTKFNPGEVTIILGPNGSGKSSFLKIFSGETTKYHGAVFYEKQKLSQFKKEALAKIRAVMSQLPELSFPLTVEEVVLMGRYPHFDFSPNKKDLAICSEVLGRMNLDNFRERNYLTLSGGEKQRVQFARVLAQVWEKPADGYRYLFLDEPLTSLDVKYQQEFLRLAKEFAEDGTVVVAVLHDINLALTYADRILFMKEGSILKEVSNLAEVTTQLINQVFDVQSKIIYTQDNRPVVIF
jgi:iron complex transport system ATP-binding protein